MIYNSWCFQFTQETVKKKIHVKYEPKLKLVISMQQYNKRTFFFFDINRLVLIYICTIYFFLPV